jgi:hypothetical protein
MERSRRLRPEFPHGFFDVLDPSDSLATFCSLLAQMIRPVLCQAAQPGDPDHEIVGIIKQIRSEHGDLPGAPGPILPKVSGLDL